MEYVDSTLLLGLEMCLRRRRAIRPTKVSLGIDRSKSDGRRNDLYNVNSGS